MDRFENFSALACKATYGVDFIIEKKQGGSNLAIMAPHGGRIEPATDILARAIAGNTHSYYAFRGIRPRLNAELHIASERFDEPCALNLARQVEMVITLHGCRGALPKVYVGGLAEDVKQAAMAALLKSGFEAAYPPPSSLQGRHLQNLCNRGRRGMGVQLELTGALRSELAANSSTGRDRFNQFVAAVRQALSRFEIRREIKPVVPSDGR